MFTVSYPELVKAQCRAGIVGSFPALNARPAELLDEWLTQIQEELKAYQAKYPERKVGPIAVNQIVHVSNTRLERDMQICVKHRIPIYITSLRAPIKEMIDAVHSYGGIVLHDVISLRHAEKALEAGVDGLILVAAGAGGHAGGLSPFALVGEVRKIFTGPIVLSGSISNGSAVLAANAMGADFAYMGTRFIASQEAHATEAYKRAIVEANASDIVYTDYFTGILGNYIKKSIENAGLDPNHLPAGDPGAFAKLSQENKDGGASKAWKDIWGAGQGVGLIDNVPTVAQIVDTLEQEYRDAKKSLLS
jgi:nitronate monooxygenase